MRRPAGKAESSEGREWWAIGAAIGCLIALYLLVGLFRDVTDRPNGAKTCNNTAQGAFFVTDDHGTLCRHSQLDPDTSCCTEGDRYSCSGCNSTSQCCAVYEPCVSCCLNPVSLRKRIDVVRDSSVNPILLRSMGNPFEFCRSLCRTSSESVVGENQYRSELKYCYGGEPKPSGIQVLLDQTVQGRSTAPSAEPTLKRSSSPTIIVDSLASPEPPKPQQYLVSQDGIAGIPVHGSGAVVLGWSALLTLSFLAFLLTLFYR